MNAGRIERGAGLGRALCRLGNRLVQFRHAADESLGRHIRHVGGKFELAESFDLEAGLLSSLPRIVGNFAGRFGQTEDRRTGGSCARRQSRAEQSEVLRHVGEVAAHL
ncbi:hypothetical protein [Mesorhizobium sp.]|uniref:hypothetical protein n=1 Tax=Mesorhizobium sp. TaxID=1871066 RepID=UPI000FE4F3EE|nr:hypothetical protein [Mesorhizobium sp.]RWE30746.1 MAG: hypothetical protein EOS77_18895 [Mesorhizobium sp.]